MSIRFERGFLGRHETWPGIDVQFRRALDRLPEPVVASRAGLIPSDEIDANPPPRGLTARQLLRWYRGLSVRLR